MGWPEETDELARFYPTSVLITGFDILFFWVARMMMMGLKFRGQVPFKQVYLHALVRDEQGQKMSKSKGNVVDPLIEMDKYGADAFRFALTAFAAMGRDVRISDKRIQGYRFFINKVWNAGKFVLYNIEGFDPAKLDRKDLQLSLADKWILAELNRTIETVRASLDGFRFNEAADALYHFTWGQFCDWYIELSKPLLRGATADTTRWVLLHVYRSILEMLHPVTPFVTEELWQLLPGKPGESIVKTAYPKADPAFSFAEEALAMEALIELISSIRSIRGEVNVPPSTRITVAVKAGNQRALIESGRAFLTDLARVETLDFLDESAERPAKSAVGVSAGVEYFIPLEGIIDIASELERLDKQIAKNEAELAKKLAKLGNADFLAKAKPEIIEKEEAIKAELEFTLEKLGKARSILV
ncbi:MAG: Valine--tRNA ligase [Deltaproteobacteria bacterium ADurb.Bin510]|nr:MAG: Valine--tRNA ligase [Deltaproteobacteria bacterium ADurb.Bin510]